MRNEDDLVSPSGMLPALTGTATAITQTNLSGLYLLSACSFARQVKSLEAENEGKEFAEFWEEIFGYASATILTTVAALESYINEFFIDAYNNFETVDKHTLSIVTEAYESKRILEKFGLALRLKKLSEFKKGDRIFQNVQLLIDLRNALVHFKPEWGNEQKEHAKLSGKLRGRFEASPFLSDSRLFPKAWASHGCCVWAIESTMAFIEEFENKTESLKRLEMFKPRFIYQ